MAKDGSPKPGSEVISVVQGRSDSSLHKGDGKSKGMRGGFPGGPVVKNPPCNARDTGWIPGWGIKIPHASEQLLSLRRTESVHCVVPYDSTKILGTATKT